MALRDRGTLFVVKTVASDLLDKPACRAAPTYTRKPVPRRYPEPLCGRQTPCHFTIDSSMLVATNTTVHENTFVSVVSRIERLGHKVSLEAA